MSLIKRSRWALFALGVALLAATACGKAAPTPLTFNVLVGEEEKTGGLQYQTFLPGDLTINVGDSIVFDKKTAQIHTVTFNIPDPEPPPFLPQTDGRVLGNPLVIPLSPAPAGPPPPPGTPLNLSVSFDGTGYVNSGFLLTENDALKVTFTKPGVYKYGCIIHLPHMAGAITVQPAKTKYPKTAADYAKEADEHLAKHKTNIKALTDGIKVPGPVAGPGGSRTFTVFAAAGNLEQGNDWKAFIGGENLTIKVGDQVNWKMEKNPKGTPHNIAFLEQGQKRPDLIVPEPQPQGPPKLFMNPLVALPSPQPSAPYAGAGHYNSGLMVTGVPTPQEFTLAFSKPGTYKYLCVIHDPSGMNGTITVQP